MLKTFSVTDIGKRRQLNQDIVFTSEKAIGNLPNVCIVADGMGGHKAGDYASRYAVETIVEELWRNTKPDPDCIIEDAIYKANSNIRRAVGEEERLSGMGTTVVVATCGQDHLTVANVGDSRLYISNKEIRQVTRDHSLVEEMVRMGGLERLAARNHPDKNIITRAVGAQDGIEIDFFHETLQQGDLVLMCSDGLTNMLEDAQIHKILSGSSGIEDKAYSLIKAANENGGKDNIAVVIMEPFAEEVVR